MSVFIGLDIGGTKFMAAAARPSGKIIHRARTAEAATQAGELAVESLALTSDPLHNDLDTLHRMVEAVAQGEKVAAIGAAAGGPLDWQSGVVSPLHQPHWRNVPLKALMEERWQCPFYVDVDTNVAALGEMHYGGCQARSLLYITISTGMGGGLVHEGAIYRGAGSVHPEIAHQAIPYRCSNPVAVRCECGAPDCLEALVSGNAIQRIYGKPARLLDEAEWNEVAYNLGQGLRNLAAILAPEEIRLGGGVAIGGGSRLLARASQVMADHLRLVPAPKVSLSSLGYDTALLGAVALALRGGFD